MVEKQQQMTQMFKEQTAEDDSELGRVDRELFVLRNEWANILQKGNDPTALKALEDRIL